MFYVKGKIDEIEASLEYTWKDGIGSVDGDDIALFMFKTALERERLVGKGIHHLARNINQPLSAFYMMQECFTELIEIKGDIPKVEALPEGVIG